MNLEEFISLRNLSALNVGDDSVTQTLVSETAISPDLAFPIPLGNEVKFNANAEGSLTIELFNNGNDHFINNVNDRLLPYWPELEALYSSGALIAYTMKGVLKGAAATTINQFQFGIDASASISIKSYLYHSRNTPINQALLNDLNKFPVLFSIEDIKSMITNSAVSYEAAGRIKLQASVKVVDAFAGSASVIAGLLNLNGRLNLKLDASLSLSFSVEVDDDFHVGIIKKSENDYHLRISKLTKRSLVQRSSFGIQAQLVNDKDLDTLVEQVVSSLDEVLFDKIEKAIREGSLQQDHLDLINQAADIIGWTKFDDVLKFVKELGNLKQKIKDKLKLFITTKVELGMLYEYKRIQTTESILDAVLTKNAIEQHHKKIITLRVDEILSARGTDVQILSYLKRELTEIDHSFGVAFAFGDFKLSSGTRNSFRQTRELILGEGRKMRVYAYNRETERFFQQGKNKQKYSLRFAADMRLYVENEAQLTAEKFDYEIGLSCELTDKKLSRDGRELYNALDWALTWDIIPQHRVEDVFEAIQKTVFEDKNRTVSYKFFLSIPDPAGDNESPFDILLPELAAVTDDKIASALGASVPYANILGSKRNQYIRSNMEARREAYKGFWIDYIKQFSAEQAVLSNERFVERIQDLLAKKFDDVGLNDLANFELLPIQYEYQEAAISRLLSLNNIGLDIKSIRNGFSILRNAVKDNLYYDRPYKNFMRQMRNIDFQKDFNLRFVGRLLLDLAEEKGVKDQIQRGFSIAYKEDDKAVLYVVG